MEINGQMFPLDLRSFELKKYGQLRLYLRDFYTRGVSQRSTNAPLYVYFITRISLVCNKPTLTVIISILCTNTVRKRAF